MIECESECVLHFPTYLCPARSFSPFLAVICFHGVHIPYVATPAMRATYPGISTNEQVRWPLAGGRALNASRVWQDYWGTITQIDAAVGRVRALLDAHGVCGSPTGWVSDHVPVFSPPRWRTTRGYP